MSGPAGSHSSAHAALRDACASASRVLLTGPMDPDGDSIGACLALARAVRALFGAQVDVAGEPTYRYAWMPGAAEMLPDARVRADYDVVVVLDGDRTRLEPPVAAAFAAASVKGIIDHHVSTEPEGYDIVLLDRHAASTTQMVCDLADAWGVPLDADLAALLYTGLVFDTGGFRHSNTTPDTLRLAARLLETGIDHNTITLRVLVERTEAGMRLMGQVLSGAVLHAGGRAALGVVTVAAMSECGATKGDLEGLVDALLYVRGVEVACLVVERSADPSRPLTKLSLRSRREVDVSRLAKLLSPGGGGHARAAGAVLERPLDAVVAELPGRMAASLGL